MFSPTEASPRPSVENPAAEGPPWALEEWRPGEARWGAGRRQGHVWWSSHGQTAWQFMAVPGRGAAAAAAGLGQMPPRNLGRDRVHGAPVNEASAHVADGQRDKAREGGGGCQRPRWGPSQWGVGKAALTGIKSEPEDRK